MALFAMNLTVNQNQQNIRIIFVRKYLRTYQIVKFFFDNIVHNNKIFNTSRPLLLLAMI